MAQLSITELTTAPADGTGGTGVYDVLMVAVKAHLEQELKKDRIKGPEYSTVYLGSLDAVLRSSLDFLLQKRKNDLEAQLLEKQILLVTEQIKNAVLEGAVLVAQECKLRAEFDGIEAGTLKTAQETTLLAQKTITERAQVQALGVEADSVIGKQKQLYQAQADGFQRDAEQKAAKIMVDSWNVRRTTDEGTVADGTNQLHDPAVGRAVAKLLGGVQA